jgi:hypothetical protein
VNALGYCPPDARSAQTAAKYGSNSAKALTNEGKYPNIVELAITVDGLDFALGRRITQFHISRHIRPRHGRRIVRQGKIYYRWCFSDPASARAFIEELKAPGPHGAAISRDKQASRGRFFLAMTRLARSWFASRPF